MNKIVAICGYGLFNPEKISYKKYLDFAFKYIRSKKIKTVVTMGGYTSLDHPNISEAQSIESYLQNKQKDVSINYLREEKSINSKQNIQFLKRMTKNMPQELIIICDKTRKLKIFWLALFYFYRLDPEKIISVLKQNQGDKFENADFDKDFIYKNIRVVGFDFKRSKDQTLWQQLGTVEEILGLYNSKVDKQSSLHRNKLFGLK